MSYKPTSRAHYNELLMPCMYIKNLHETGMAKVQKACIFLITHSNTVHAHVLHIHA